MSSMRVPFFERTRGDHAVEDELVQAFLRVLHSGHYILGAEVERFEARCAERLGVRHAIAVSSGSDALTLALLPLGIGPGDEVICPAFTFFATAGSIVRLGAKPVFADIEPGSFNIDPESVRARINSRTRAILPVHLFGRAANIDALAAITSLPIVEDAAQAIGTRVGPKSVGALGQIGCFSFFPSKNLGGFGDGGLLTTSDDALADKARILRVHGGRPKHHHAMVGYNFRLDALQAALLGVKMDRLDDAIAKRSAHAASYSKRLAAAGLSAQNGANDAPIITPEAVEGATFNQYVIRLRGEGTRDRLKTFLAERGVGSEIYYPVPLHLQPCFASLGYAEGSLPAAEEAAKQVLALPIFPELREDEIAYVADQIEAFFR